VVSEGPIRYDAVLNRIFERCPMYSENKKSRPAFAIFCRTLCQGVIPTWRDEKGYPVTYVSEREAQLEIVDATIELLEQFIAGERDYADTLMMDDFVLPVEVWPDGSISTEAGDWFGPIEP
jgi:hypothetical protein